MKKYYSSQFYKSNYEYYLKKIGKGLVQLISKGYLVVYNDIECLSG